MAEQDLLRIGLVQAELKWREPQANREHLQQLLGSVDAELDIAIFPETFTTGFLGELSELEDMQGATVSWMQQLASEHGCVITGSAVMGSPEGRRNRLLWVEPEGPVHYYDKRHLFGYAGEDKRYVAGRERVLFDYRGWRILPQICYDLRFPVWCRNRSDYDLMLIVANWPSPRVDAWSTLLKARAMENQCYVAAVNRVGEDGKGNRYPGQSVVHDGLGAACAQMDADEGCAVAEISLARLRELREQLPFLRDADRFNLCSDAQPG
jgi:predicted amidohydrolase